MTALLYAASAGHLEAAEILVDSGADVSMCNVGGCNAADIAPSGSEVQDYLFSILSKKFSSKKHNYFRSQSLVQAAEDGDFSRVQILLAMRANPNSHNGTHTALQVMYPLSML